MLKKFGIDIDFEKIWDEGVLGIRNCKFKFECEKKWGELERIEGVKDLRFCSHCLKEVHYVDDGWDLVLAMEKDWCVAIPHTLVITAKGIKSLHEPLMGSLIPSINRMKK